MNVFEAFGKVLRGLFVAMILVAALFAVFPIILLGVDGVNATHNASMYFGLVDLNNLAPLLVYLSILGLVAAPFAANFWASSRPSSVGKQPVGSGLLLSPAHRLKGPWSRLSKLLVAGRELCPLLSPCHQPLSFVLGFEQQGGLAGDGFGSGLGIVSHKAFSYELSFEGPQENTQKNGMMVSHVCRSYRVPCWFFGGLPSLLLTYFLSGLTFINRFSFSILFLYYFYCGAAPISSRTGIS